MIEITAKYKCDKCKKEYIYKSNTSEVGGKSILLRVINKDFCRQCLKDLIITE